jgi:hypothetical protein
VLLARELMIFMVACGPSRTMLSTASAARLIAFAITSNSLTANGANT